METKRLLELFSKRGIRISKGNNIFPSGNAVKYLAEYFTEPETVDLSIPCGSSPYTARLDEIDSISINPNGDISVCSVTIGNIYSSDALEIVDKYDPYNIPESRAILKGGVSELLCYAKSQGVTVDICDCRSACGVCNKIMAALESKTKKV